MSALVAAGLTVLVALVLTPLFRSLPEATLGAIVVVAISGMVRVRELRRLYPVRRVAFALALVALVGVLLFDVLPGHLGAVVLSVLLLVYHAGRPDLSALGRLPGGDNLVDVSRTPESRPVPGLLIVRPNEGSIVANAAPLHERISSPTRASDPPPRAVLLDLEMSSALDVPGADALADLHEELGQCGIGLLLSPVHPQVRETLDRSGGIARIGEHHSYRRSIAAVRDFAATPGAGPAPERG